MRRRGKRVRCYSAPQDEAESPSCPGGRPSRRGVGAEARRPRRPPPRPQAFLAAACGVGCLQVLTWALKSGASLWRVPLAIPTVYSFAATAATWGLFWCAQAGRPRGGGSGRPSHRSAQWWLAAAAQTADPRTPLGACRWFAWELPLMCLLGVVGGALGALWSALCVRLLALRDRYVPPSRPLLRAAETVAVAALTATVRCLPSGRQPRARGVASHPACPLQRPPTPRPAQAWIGISYASPCRELPPSDAQGSLASAGVGDWCAGEPVAAVAAGACSLRLACRLHSGLPVPMLASSAATPPRPPAARRPPQAVF